MADAVVKDGRVQLRDANGGAFSVTEDEARQALSGGEFRLETPEEFEVRAVARERSTLGQQAILTAEKLGRGATFGLSEAVASEVGGAEYRQAASERAAENPRLAMAAEIAGAIAPTLLSGGAGAVGTVARATPAALAGRVAMGAERAAGAAGSAIGLGGKGLVSAALGKGLKSAVSAGVETGLYGLGTSLADSALEGTDWTAERALAGLQSGIAYGAIGGGALGAGGVVAGRAARRAAREVVDSMINTGATFRRAVENWAEERAGSALDDLGAREAQLVDKLTGGGKNPERLERIQARFAEAGIESGSRAEVSAFAKQEAAAAAQAQAQVAAEVVARGGRVNGTEIRATIDDAFEELKALGNVEATTKLRKFVGKAPESIEEAERLQLKLDELADWARKSKSTALPEIEKVSENVSKHIDAAAAETGPAGEAMWKAARESARDWRTLAGRLGKEPLTDSEIGKIIGVAGTVASIATGSVLPYLATAAIGQSAPVRQFVRERGGASLGWLAQHTGWFERSSRSVAKRIAGVGGENPVEAVGAALKKPAKSAPLESIALFPKAADDAAKGPQYARSYAAIAASIAAARQNPSYIEERTSKVIGPIAAAQPEVAVAMARIMAEDHAWLSSKAPNPGMTPHTITPKAEKGQVPRREQQRIVAYANALSNPMSVFASIADGRVDWDGIEALKARRPDMWNSMRMQVIQETAASEDKIEPRRRALIGLAFEFPADWSMANVGTFQQIGAQPPDQGNGKPAIAGVSTEQYDLPGQSPGTP